MLEQILFPTVFVCNTEDHVQLHSIQSASSVAVPHTWVKDWHWSSDEWIVLLSVDVQQLDVLSTADCDLREFFFVEVAHHESKVLVVVLFDFIFYEIDFLPVAAHIHMSWVTGNKHFVLAPLNNGSWPFIFP